MNWGKAGIIRLAIIVSGLLLVASCGDKLTGTKNKDEKAVNEVAGITQDEIAKYNKYIEFNNYAVKNVSKNIDEYLKHIGKDLPSKDVRLYITRWGTYKWMDVKELPTTKPLMKEIDDPAAELIPVAENLNVLLSSAYDYYNAKDYKEDNFAKGQELHKKILAEIPKFEAAQQKLSAALENKETTIVVQEMNNAKKNGQELTYNKILVLLSMKKIMAELERQNISAANVISTDLTKIKPLYEEFAAAQKALRDTANSSKYKDQTIVRLSVSFISETTNFKTEMIELIERVEAKKALRESELESPESTSGTPEKLYKIRGSAIDDYNRNR